MAMSRVLAGQHRGSARRSARRVVAAHSTHRTASIGQRWSATGNHQITISKLNSRRLFAGKWLRAVATIDDEGLEDATAANPFRFGTASASLQHTALLADVRMS